MDRRVIVHCDNLTIVKARYECENKEAKACACFHAANGFDEK